MNTCVPSLRKNFTNAYSHLWDSPVIPSSFLYQKKLKLNFMLIILFFYIIILPHISLNNFVNFDLYEKYPLYILCCLLFAINVLFLKVIHISM